MFKLLLIIHVVTALILIALVLIQNGKGADLSATLGGGNANTMLGNVGMVSFIVKFTAMLGAIFFITSIGLGALTAKQAKARVQALSAAKVTAQLALHDKNA